MTNYDDHLFMEELINRKYPIENFKVVLQTDERLNSSICGRIKIIGFMIFMKMCLDTIVKAIDLDNFIHTRKIFGDG